MKILLSFATLAVAALLMQTTAKAQDSTSSSGSTSSSSSSSGSVSGSRSGSSTSGTSGNSQRSNQRVNSTTNIPITFNSTDPAGANGSNGGSNGGGAGNGSLTPGGSTGQPYYGQSDVTIRSAPPVYAPNVQGGNPCTVGYSVGVSWIGAGVAGGMSTVDQDCADRQAIAMVHNAGYTAEAREMMCNNKSFYMAARSVGKPCAARTQFEGPGAPAPPPIVQQQPVPLAPQQQVIVKDRSNLPRCSRTITDNCWAG